MICSRDWFLCRKQSVLFTCFSFVVCVIISIIGINAAWDYYEEPFVRVFYCAIPFVIPAVMLFIPYTYTKIICDQSGMRIQFWRWVLCQFDWNDIVDFHFEPATFHTFSFVILFSADGNQKKIVIEYSKSAKKVLLKHLQNTRWEKVIQSSRIFLWKTGQTD